VERILNKRKVREGVKYLVQWKRFIAEHDSWKKEKNLENVKELDVVEKKHFRRGELPGKYTAKMLYGWNDEKFKEEYLKKLEKNWKR